MQITEHIHALKIPFYVEAPQGRVPRFVYVYLIYGEQICLIDSGVASSEKMIIDYLKETGRSPDDISLLILTHSHPDHIGAAQAVKRTSGCMVAAHNVEKAWIEDIDLQARDRPVPGFRSLVEGSVRVDTPLEDGDVLEIDEGMNLKAIHTPGHSRGSISLWLPGENALFSADAVPIPGDMPIYEDLIQSYLSIEKLRAISAIEFLLASWDDPRKGESAYRTLDEGLRYLQIIHEAVLKACSKSDIGNHNRDSMDMCRAVLKELGMPETIANPLIARSFMASMAVVKDRIPWAHLSC